MFLGVNFKINMNKFLELFFGRLQISKTWYQDLHWAETGIPKNGKM